VDEHPDRTDVILELLGKGQRLSHQPRNPLPQGVVQSFDVAGQATIFANRPMSFAWNDIEVGLPVIGVNLGTLSVYSWDGLPSGNRRFPRALTDVTPDDFSGVCIYRQPDPLLVAFVVDK
jgi:hypothetical protein